MDSNNIKSMWWHQYVSSPAASMTCSASFTPFTHVASLEWRWRACNLLIDSPSDLLPLGTCSGTWIMSSEAIPDPLSVQQVNFVWRQPRQGKVWKSPKPYLTGGLGALCPNKTAMTAGMGPWHKGLPHTASWTRQAIAKSWALFAPMIPFFFSQLNIWNPTNLKSFRTWS